MGFANFAVDAHANAAFRDDAARAPACRATCVRVYAKVAIEEGQEIRVDYDMGDVQAPTSEFLHLLDGGGGRPGCACEPWLRGLQGERMGDTKVAAGGSRMRKRDIEHV